MRFIWWASFDKTIKVLLVKNYGRLFVYDSNDDMMKQFE